MGTRVLIIEDSSVIQERIKSMLATLDGITVLGHAETAEEAIAAIKLLKPDAITLDIGLRIGNGFDVLRWLSKNESDQPQVIVLTLIEKDSIKERLAAWKVFAILDKSSEFSHLPRVLTDLTRQGGGDVSAC